MAANLKWLLPIAAILGVGVYLVVDSSSTLLSPESAPESATESTASTPGYQLPPAAFSAGQKQPIHVDDAFKLVMHTQSEGVISARFDIEPNFYLYRDKIKVTGPDGARLVPSFPASTTKRDEHFGDSEVFDQSFAFTVPATATANGEMRVSATYQGCENEGICYPPVTKHFDIKPGSS